MSHDPTVPPDPDQAPSQADERLPVHYQEALVEAVADLDIVTELINRNLQQEDISRILVKLSSSNLDLFTAKLAELLRKTSALLLVSRRLSDSLSLDVLLPRMVELISDFLGAERCTIFLHDRTTDELYTKAAVGLSEEIRFPSGQGIAGAVFRSGEPIHIPDAYADPRFNPEVDRRTGFRTRNILCVPVKHTAGAQTRIVGVAQVLNKRVGAFSEADLSLLDTLNSQAASAFVNALLHEEIQRARAEEVQLLEVTQAMSTELQLHPLLLKIMTTVAMILEADRATLFMHERRTHELWAVVGDGARVTEIRFPDHVGIAGSVFTTGQTINIPDAYADPRFNPEVDRTTGYRTQNILCMPVVNRRGDTIAVTQVLNKRGGPFSGIDEKRLRAFSAQASIAMENAKLFHEVNRIKNYNERILEGMSNGVVTVSSADILVKANRAALGLLCDADRPGGVLGRRAAELFVGPNAWIAEAVADARRDAEPAVAVDADVRLPLAGNEGRPRTASVNLSTLPLAEDDEGTLGCLLMIEDLTNEKRLKTTMARYMTKEVADKLLEEGEAALGGKSQPASILFSDIRDFTAISERIGPQETVRLLNEYFGIMVDIIFEKGGILDKYIGDAIMAVFGAPFRGPEDADHAVQAGIDMLRALRVFNAHRQASGQDPIRIGLGINTDVVLSGNIGSLKRMDYTVIGDGVNLAARLESANRSYGTELLVSELTVAELKGSYELREVDRIRVKGKSHPIGVFEVLDHYGQDSPARRPALLEEWAEALRLYREREFAEAARRFAAVAWMNPEDRAAYMYAVRCATLIQAPPGPDWDGVWVMTEK